MVSAEALPNRPLRNLMLGYNQIGEVLSKGALNNLVHLDLNYNSIGYEGMRSFSEALSLSLIHI